MAIDDGRVAEGEEVADAERALRPLDLAPLVHQLAGGVVDGRDVVGVEGVAQAQGVGEDAHPDPEALVVARDDEGDEDPEADDVQGQDRAAHPTGPAPVARAEHSSGAADPAQGRRCLRHGHAASSFLVGCGRSIDGPPAALRGQRSETHSAPCCDLLASALPSAARGGPSMLAA